MPALGIDRITLDERCQPRVSLDPELIDDYAAAMTGGAAFPPLTVYREGETYWLADGFHRIYAAKQAGATEIACDIRPGTLRDAILCSVSANATHGLRRTNLDKRRAVETLLSDPEWTRWSDNEIATRCVVSQPFVSKMRGSLITVISDPPDERIYTTKHGTTATMQTANIGKRRERVDRESGEILDDGPPSCERVDPTDPQTFLLDTHEPDHGRGERMAREIAAADALLRLADLTDTDPNEVGDDLALRGKPGRDVLERSEALIRWIGRVRMAVANTAYAGKGHR